MARHAWLLSRSKPYKVLLSIFSNSKKSIFYLIILLMGW